MIVAGAAVLCANWRLAALVGATGGQITTTTAFQPPLSGDRHFSWWG